MHRIIIRIELLHDFEAVATLSAHVFLQAYDIRIHLAQIACHRVCCMVVFVVAAIATHIVADHRQAVFRYLLRKVDRKIGSYGHIREREAQQRNPCQFPFDDDKDDER